MYCTKLLRTALAQVSASSATASTSAAPLVPALPVESPYVHLPLTLWPRRRRHQPGSRTSLQDEAENTTPDSKSVPEIDPDVYTSIVSLPSDVFHVPHRPDVLHQCVVAHLASLRQGTARTKNRAEVRGSNRKLHRQKGTGRARVGDAASPTRRGGGRAFPKRQRDFSKDLNDKVWKLGLRSALSERWRRGDITIIPKYPTFRESSTAELKYLLSEMPDALAPTNPYHTDFSHSKILFLLSHIQDRFANSARNLPNVEVELVDDIDVYPLLQGDKIVMDLKAVELLDEWLGNTRAPSSFSPDFVEDYLHEEELGARQLEGEELGKNMKEINYASVNGPSSQTLVERMGPVLAATAMSLAEARH